VKSKQEKIRPDDYHELVYQAAKEANSKDDLKKKLDKLAKSHSSFFIDEVKVMFESSIKAVPEAKILAFTAASRLAYEIANTSDENNDQLSIKGLCELGASAEEIAMGFAVAGDATRADAYHKLKNVDPAVLVYGFFLGQGWEKGGALAQKYIDEYEVSPVVIAGALAARGDEKALDKYYEVISKDPKIDLLELIQTICINAARCGNFSVVEDYKRFYPKDRTNDLLPFIVKGYAMAGSAHIMDNFLELVGKEIPEIDNNLVVHAIKGYIEVGAHNNVKTLCQQLKLKPEIIAEAYIECGNTGRAKEYSIQTLLNSYYEERSAVRDEKTKEIKQYKGLPIPFFQKSFKEKEEAITALVKVLNGEAPANFDLRQHLSTLRDGNLGKALRKFVKEGMADHFVGEEVRTVTAFITALEKKIPKPGHTY
jgi:hypothetical protein